MAQLLYRAALHSLWTFFNEMGKASGQVSLQYVSESWDPRTICRDKRLEAKNVCKDKICSEKGLLCCKLRTKAKPHSRVTPGRTDARRILRILRTAMPGPEQKVGLLP